MATKKKDEAEKTAAKKRSRKPKAAAPEAAAAPTEPAATEAPATAATEQVVTPPTRKAFESAEAILDALSMNQLQALLPSEVELMEEYRQEEGVAEYWGLFKQGEEEVLPALDWSNPKVLQRVGRNRRDMLKFESDLSDLLKLDPDAETEILSCEHVRAVEVKSDPKAQPTFTEEDCQQKGPLSMVFSTAFGPRPAWRKLNPEICKWFGMEHFADVCMCARCSDAVMSEIKYRVKQGLIKEGLSKNERRKAMHAHKWGSPLMVTHMLVEADFHSKREHGNVRRQAKETALSNSLRGANIEVGTANAVAALKKKAGIGR